MSAFPRPVVALVQRQLGVVSRGQLSRWWTGDRIDGLVRRGTLVRVERGVYRVRGSGLVPGQRAIAAALRAGAPASVTGPAVLGFHGVDGFTPDDAFEVLAPSGRRLTGVRFGWRHDPRPERPLVRRGAVGLTVPEDAAVHSARWRGEIGDRRLRLAVHWLGWRGMLDRDAFLDRLVRRAAVDEDAASLLEVLGGVVLGRCESEGERQLGTIVTCCDPPPEPQVRLHPGRRSDWFFRQLAVALEYDGVIDHSGEQDRAADRGRDAELRAAGIEVVRVTDADLRDRPALTRRIASVLTRRALELGVAAPRFDPSPRGEGP